MKTAKESELHGVALYINSDYVMFHDISKLVAKIEKFKIQKIYFENNDMGIKYMREPDERKDNYEMLLAAIAKNKHIIALDLSRCKLGEDFFEGLGNMLNEIKNIFWLDISGNSNNYKGLVKFLKVLQNNKTITMLDAKNLDDGRLTHLFEMLNKNTSIFSLGLSSNFLDEHLKDLIKLVVENKKIAKLDLSFVRISKDDMISLLNALKKNTKIRKLNLSGIFKENEKLKSIIGNIADLLNENDVIKELDLSSNKINEKDFRLFFKAIKKTDLKTLLLNDNDFDEKFYSALAEMIEKNTPIEKLALFRNFVNEKSIDMLVQALKSNDNLEDINFSNSSYREEESEDLSKSKAFSILKHEMANNKMEKIKNDNIIVVEVIEVISGRYKAGYNYFNDEVYRNDVNNLLDHFDMLSNSGPISPRVKAIISIIRRYYDSGIYDREEEMLIRTWIHRLNILRAKSRKLNNNNLGPLSDDRYIMYPNISPTNISPENRTVQTQTIDNTTNNGTTDTSVNTSDKKIKETPVKTTNKKIKQTTDKKIKETPVKTVDKTIKETPVNTTDKTIKETPVNTTDKTIKETPVKNTKGTSEVKDKKKTGFLSRFRSKTNTMETKNQKRSGFLNKFRPKPKTGVKKDQKKTSLLSRVKTKLKSKSKPKSKPKPKPKPKLKIRLPKIKSSKK